VYAADENPAAARRASACFETFMGGREASLSEKMTQTVHTVSFIESFDKHGRRGVAFDEKCANTIRYSASA
jgi:hypothetical protein